MIRNFWDKLMICGIGGLLLTGIYIDLLPLIRHREIKNKIDDIDKKLDDRDEKIKNAINDRNKTIQNIIDRM